MHAKKTACRSPCKVSVIALWS